MVNVLPFGDDAVLVETAAPVALHRALAAPPRGVRETVPAAATVLVTFDPALISRTAVVAWISSVEVNDLSVAEGPLVTVPVRYDGDDLAAVAALLEMTPDALVAQHLAAHWTVAFTGFAPGFGYLTSPDWTHRIPRLAAPRTRVPAGAVALADTYCGAYPRETPGGWQLIGTTTVELFSLDRDQPALLAPGTRVRFEAQRDVVVTNSGESDELRTQSANLLLASSDSPDFAGPALRVEAAGPGALIQTLGRPGHRALGVAPAGAADQSSLVIANRLVGNDEDAAGLEVLLGGLRVRADADATVAVTGAEVLVSIDGRPVDLWRAHPVRAGSEISLGIATRGARAYVAFGGGINAMLRDGRVHGPALGSLSADTMSGIGAPPLRAGDTLMLGARCPIPPLDIAPWRVDSDDVTLQVRPGPRLSRFAPSAWRTLTEETWTITTAADRVGVRLDGPELVRADTREIPSEGMVVGALQVPPSGRPVILLADGPVTGGYPVIGVIASADRARLGQLRPGARVRLRP